MTSNQLTEQQIDLLIENGYDIAHTLENLAENEINSDCFEVFSYSENGRETEWDGKITEFAQRAAKAIRHLTDATTALQAELQERRKAAMDSEPVALTANIERDAQRYRFLRERDAFGDDGEPGLASWDDLIELDTNDFDAAIDARMAHPSVDFLTLDNALQKHERRRCKDRNCNKPIYGYSVDGLCEDCYAAVSQQPAPVVPEDVRQALSKMDDEIIAELDAEESACRAAMLAAAPQEVKGE